MPGIAFIKYLNQRQTSDGKYLRYPRRAFNFFGKSVVDEDGSMQIAAFNRGVVYISTQIAKLPWDVKGADKKIISGNPIASLLNLEPNTEMSAFMMKTMLIQQAIIHGNAFCEIERNIQGAPIALWPLFSRGMEMRRDPDTGRLFYRYTANLAGGSSAPTDLDPEDVFHVKNFHTKDAIVGQGVVAYGKEVLGINIATDDMAGGLFRNGGLPSGVVTHPGTMSDEAYRRLKDSWKEQQGSRNAGGTAILEEGSKYEAINHTPDTLQFLQSRQFGVLEIARFLGLPPTKLFDVVAAKYANVENSNLEVATDTLHSWSAMLCQEADIKLLNSRYGGRYTEIDLYEIFRGDMASRATYFKTMMSVGAMTPNEIRDREGLPSYPQGDNFYIATNNFTPVDRMDEIIDADIEQKTKPAAAPAQPPAKKGGSEDDRNESQKQVAAAVIKYLNK